MNDEYNEQGLLGGKGFYIALLLCVSIIAVSAWMIFRNQSKDDQADALAEVTVTPYEIPVNQIEDEPEPTVVLQVEEPDVVGIIDPAPVDEPVQEVTVQEEPAVVETVNQTVSTYLWPVYGDIKMPYSMEALTYNVTMGDWRTHDGIDILAQEGSEVHAACAGTVIEVYDDDLYGTTVVIDNGNGLMSYYANLGDEPIVNTGDRLLTGDVSGTVGSTAICESAEPTHLHFAMSLNENSVNPLDYLPAL